MTKVVRRCIRVPGPATVEEVAALRRLVERRTLEGPIERFFEQHPALLAPLEFAEFATELRLPKADKVHGNTPPGRLRPDLTGVKVFPEAFPFILEMKRPAHLILDHDSLALSAVSSEACGQVLDYAMHLFRSADREELRRSYGWDVKRTVGAEIVQAVERYEGGMPRGSEADRWALTRKISEAGVSLVALIGHSAEFGANGELLARAKSLFAERGILLVTYDELIRLGEVLAAFANEDESLRRYFTKDRLVSSDGSGLCRFRKFAETSDDVARRIQGLIYRSHDAVRIFGFGAPTEPAVYSGRQAVYHAGAAFDIRRLQDPPTFLQGREALVWAGRWQGHWLVAKRRLSEPLLGAIVWYVFDPPTEIPPFLDLA